MELNKKCIKCNELKNIEDFRKVKEKYRNECKECARIYNRQYQKSEKRKEYLNSDKMKEYKKEYSKEYENTEKRKKYWEKYESTDSRKEYRRKYESSDKMKEYKKEYSKEYENTEKRKKYWEKYESTDSRKEYKTIYNRSYRKKRKMNDPLFKLSISIGNRIRESIHKMGYSKKSKTKIILGCDFEEFKNHIENLFQEGMSWENYGKDINGWQLDHIMPISIAKSEEDVVKLNHYSNFQPLWAIDNIKKSNKIDWTLYV